MLTNIKNWLVQIVQKCLQVYFHFHIQICRSSENTDLKSQACITVAIVIQLYFPWSLGESISPGGISPIPEMSGNDGNMKKTSMNLV